MVMLTDLCSWCNWLHPYHWRIQGGRRRWRPPKGPDSFILTYMSTPHGKAKHRRGRNHPVMLRRGPSLCSLNINPSFVHSQLILVPDTAEIIKAEPTACINQQHTLVVCTETIQIFRNVATSGVDAPLQGQCPLWEILDPPLHMYFCWHSS